MVVDGDGDGRQGRNTASSQALASSGDLRNPLDASAVAVDDRVNFNVNERGRAWWQR
ncbi:MAG TPA: hypothetical protein VFG30_02740 [Polyangiales bacterium]|nr:hypothetical protein [Polyangiales bacterium]